MIPLIVLLMQFKDKVFFVELPLVSVMSLSIVLGVQNSVLLMDINRMEQFVEQQKMNVMKLKCAILLLMESIVHLMNIKQMEHLVEIVGNVQMVLVQIKENVSQVQPDLAEAVALKLV